MCTVCTTFTSLSVYSVGVSHDRSLAELLKSTVCENKGNSILIIGPRGVGKTWVSSIHTCNWMMSFPVLLTGY